MFEDSKVKYPIIEDYEIDGERLLQILSLYHLRTTNKFPEATRTQLLSLQPEFITEKWDEAARHLSHACRWVKNLGATAKTQPPHGTMVSIATTLMCFPKSLEDPNFSAALRRWYFCTTLAANPSPSNNYKIGNDFRGFCEFLERNEPIQYPRVYFEIDDLIRIKNVTDSRYKAIQALMRTTVKEDLLTGNYLEDELEDHHIFPYSLTRSGIPKAKLNSIVNKIIVSKSTNRKIGNDNPDKYLVELAESYKGSDGDLERRFRNSFIPYSSSDTELKVKLSKDNFETFLEERAELLVSRIKEVVGESWQAPIEDEVNLEDDEFVSS